MSGPPERTPARDHQGPARIDLRVGHPGADLLPFEELRAATAAALAREDATTLQYGDEQGSPAFREELAGFVTRHGAPAEPGGLLVTAGISQSLDLLCTLTASAGDVVLVEEPSYHLAKLVFRDHGLRQVGVASDEHGLVPEALAEALEREPRARLLYLVPTYGNPSGDLLAPARYERIVELAEEHGLLVLSDEVYRLLDFAGRPPASLASLGSERVVALNSFSKILAPGLRLGWLDGPEWLLERVEGSGMVQSGGGLNPFVASVVRETLANGAADAYLERLRATYRERAQALARGLERAFGQAAVAAEFEVPRGGYFVWLRLPGTDAEALLTEARAHGVNYAPGPLFSAAGRQRDRYRLSFAYHQASELEMGAARLARTVESHHEP